MEAFNYVGDHITPTIIFDPGKNLFILRGRSFPDDAHTFYEPALQWLEEYAKNPNDGTVFSIMLYYFNSATAKILLEIFNILQQIHDSGKKVTVRWLYHEDDEIIREQGEDFKDLFSFDFEFVSYPNKTIN